MGTHEDSHGPRNTFRAKAESWLSEGGYRATWYNGPRPQAKSPRISSGTISAVMSPIDPPSALADNERFATFASATVHNLREPVRMVQLYTEVLEDATKDHLQSEAVQAVEMLRKAAAQMQRLIDGLADFAAAATSGAISPSEFRLDLPLRQALLELDSELKNVNAVVQFEDLPTVVCDFDRLQTVFHNLIRNAIQYRGDKPLEISILSRAEGNDWLIQVTDNGPGVPAQFHRKIFELYTRLHGRDKPGNGLGLAICRTIIENHGGRIWVEPAATAGTTISFLLPGAG